MKKIVALLFAFGLLLVAAAGAQDEPLFQVVPNSNLNLRACASTNCERVGQVQAGTELPVYAVDGDWYQVQVDDGLAWIAGWLTTRAPTPRPTRTPTPVPDRILEMEEIWYDSKTGCYITVAMESGDRSLVVLRSGEKRHEAQIDVFLPGERAALPVRGSFEDSYVDTGDPYILQYYSPNIRWHLGRYRIQLDLGDATSVFEWKMERTGKYIILIHCGPLTFTPTATPRPTRTPIPLPDVVLRPEVLYHDRNTGCDIILYWDFEEIDLDILLAGDKQSDVMASVYRPGSDLPLPVTGRLDHLKFIGIDKSYILQTYNWSWAWHDDWYRLEISLDGNTSEMSWWAEHGGYDINVVCDQTATPRPHSTTVQPGVCSSIAALQTDLESFWRDLREANHPHSATDPGAHIRFSASVQLQRIRDALPVNWPVESTTARDLEHLIDSSALDYPNSHFYTSNLYVLYMMTARVAPDTQVLLAGLSHSPAGGTSYHTLSPNQKLCLPIVERQLHYLLERNTSSYLDDDMCFEDFFETYMSYRFNATETTQAIAQGFAEVARTAAMMDSSIESLVEDCS